MTTTKTTKWKKIGGKYARYSASSDGDIRRDATISASGKRLKPRVLKTRYMPTCDKVASNKITSGKYVQLYTPTGEVVHVSVPVLVAQAWLPGFIEHVHQVHFHDGDANNADPSNLYYLTASTSQLRNRLTRALTTLEQLQKQ